MNRALLSAFYLVLTIFLALVGCSPTVPNIEEPRAEEDANQLSSAEIIPDDPNDPDSWISKLPEAQSRDQALVNLERIWGEKMVAALHDRRSPELLELTQTIEDALIQAYSADYMVSDGMEDAAARNKIVVLLSKLDTPRALPVYKLALTDLSENKIHGAHKAAQAILMFCQSTDPNAYFLPLPSKQDDCWKDRCKAASQATDSLLRALENVRTQRAARGVQAENTPEEDELTGVLVLALGNIVLGNPEIPERNTVVEKLIEVLLTSDMIQDLRNNMYALKALGKLGDSQAIPSMVRALFIQGKRRPVALQEIARESIMQIDDLEAMAEALVKAGRMEDQELNDMLDEDLTFDPRLIKEQVAVTLGQMGLKTGSVIDYLMEELNHSKIDTFDILPSRGAHVFKNPKQSRAYRRAWAGRALGKLRYRKALPIILKRLRAKKRGIVYGPVEKNTVIEEWPSYLDAAGDFLVPRQSDKLILAFFAFGDDAILDRAGRRLMLQSDSKIAGHIEKRGKKLPECEPGFRFCLRDNFLKRYAPVLRSTKGCTTVECWIGKLGDSNGDVRQRAAYQMIMLADGDEPASDQARDALIKTLGSEERRPAVFNSLVFATDRLSPRGCDQQQLETLRERIADLRGNLNHAQRRKLTGLHSRLEYRSKSR